MNEIIDYLNIFGLVVAIWFPFGIYYVSRKIPDYSQSQNYLSELGAKGSPSKTIHPFINNIPLAVLFVGFGISVYLNQAIQTSSMSLVALLIILHGVSHLGTAIFPCDEDLGEKGASFSQKAHNIIGLVLMLSLLIAAMVVGLQKSQFTQWFVIFTWVCIIISIGSTVLFGRSIKLKHNMGLYQRISYGSLIIWVATLSIVINANT